MFDDSTIEIVALGSYLVILLGIGVAGARQIALLRQIGRTVRRLRWTP